MRQTFHPLARWPIPAVLFASAFAHAGSTATLVNRSKTDLLIARAGADPVCPLMVRGEGDAGLCEVQQLPHQPGLPAATDEAKSSEPSSAGPAKTFFLLKDGATATLSCAEPGKDLQAELVLFHLGSDGGIVFKGILSFTLEHRPGSGAPEAKLTLPGAPTPRMAAPGCNRHLKQVSPGEVWILTAPDRAVKDRPAAPLEALPEFL